MRISHKAGEIVSKKDLTLLEKETLRYPKQPTPVITANGSKHTIRQATIFVTDLDTFVTVQLLEDTPAVLSLCNHCEENGYVFSSVSHDTSKCGTSKRRRVYSISKWPRFTTLLCTVTSSRNGGATGGDYISREADALRLSAATAKLYVRFYAGRFGQVRMWDPGGRSCSIAGVRSRTTPAPTQRSLPRHLPWWIAWKI